MPSAKSIIVIGVASRAAPPEPEDVSLRGRIAGIGVNKDYHQTVKAMLIELAERLKGVMPFEYKIFTDVGHLNERALAIQAGLGFCGKNRTVISEKFGSFFNIGYMLTDLILSPSGRVAPSTCGNCRRCIDACPGKAFENGFEVHKCCSYLTQKKDSATEDEAGIMGNWLYGCDICQDVCPFNLNVEQCGVEDAYPLLAVFVNITDTEFERLYADSSLFWCGAERFRRNAEIAKDHNKNKIREK
jgi:epoxyqueuosine reductase